MLNDAHDDMFNLLINIGPLQKANSRQNSTRKAEQITVNKPTFKPPETDSL